MLREFTTRLLTNCFFLILLIFLILLLQFKKQSFSFRLGDFNITLYKTIENEQPKVSYILLTGRTIEFLLENNKIFLQEGLFEKPLTILDYRIDKNTFIITLQNHIQLSFFLDEDKFLIISAENLPSESASLKSFITLKPQSKIKIEKNQASILSLNYKNRQSQIVLNEESSWQDFKNKSLIISRNPIKIGPLISSSHTDSPDLSLEQSQPQLKQQEPHDLKIQSDPISDISYNQVINDFRKKSYQGVYSRYNQNLGEWLNEENKYIFDERLSLILLAESLTENRDSAILPLMKKAIIQHPNLTTLDTSLYVGDIINKHIDTIAYKQTMISELMKRPSLEITIKENSAKDLYLYGESGEFERILSLWEKTDILKQNWSLDQISLFLHNYSDTREFLKEPPSEDIIKQLEDIIKKSLFKKKSNSLAMENKQISIKTSIILGSSIQRLTKNNKYFKAIHSLGKNLVYKALKLSNEQGMIEDHSKKQRIYPEEIYQYVSNNPFLPKIIILSQLEKRWIYLASEVESSNFNELNYALNLSFSQEIPEYLIFSNIPYPSSVNFRSTSWRTDPQFQMYTDGWSYSQRNQSLYIKMSHFLGKTIDLVVEIKNPD